MDCKDKTSGNLERIYSALEKGLAQAKEEGQPVLEIAQAVAAGSDIGVEIHEKMLYIYIVEDSKD